jgi:ribonuclease BN (tRNA processing enzyme)
MRFNFLGAGSAFTLKNFQSNAILEIDGKKLLIDCGGDIRYSLAAAGITLLEIDGIYVTHKHADHWGGAEYVAYSSFFHPGFVVDGVRRKIKLFTHHSVRLGLFDSMEGSTVLADRKTTLDTFFDVQQFVGEAFEWEGLKLSTVKVMHCLDNGVPMPVYGLTWKTPCGRTVWYSADAVLNAAEPLFEQADVIFHDCETAAPTGVHAHYTEHLQLPPEVKKKMTLYHYNDGNRADAIADGFAGWAEKGAWVDLT